MNHHENSNWKRRQVAAIRDGKGDDDGESAGEGAGRGKEEDEGEEGVERKERLEEQGAGAMEKRTIRRTMLC